MAVLYDLITASNLSGFYEANPVDRNLGDRLFPSRQQLGLQLSQIKGGSGAPVILKPSAFDTRAVLRGRKPVEFGAYEMPYFKEAMLVKEQDRQQLNLVSASGNQAMVDMLINNIFNDQLTLLEAANTRLEAMRMEILATGALAINDNGVVKDIDYGVPEEHKGDAEVFWSEGEADPLADIDRAINIMENDGVTPTIAVMNSATFGNIRKSLQAESPNGRIGRAEAMDILMDEFGLTVEIKNGVFVNDEGKSVKFFPDGVVTLAPNDSLGNTVFGTTPEESDLTTGQSDAQVSMVDSGIAVTTQQLVDPVNVQTKVSFIGLPSFELADAVYILNTESPAV